MNVSIIENPDLNEDDVVIECKERNSDIDSAAELLREKGSRIIGVIDGRRFLICITDILYFESVDKSTFFYTSANVYRTELRLYEVYEKYYSRHFIRVSKSMVVNMLKIDEISPFLAGKLRLKLTNGEYIMVSRQYAAEIKHELGI